MRLVQLRGNSPARRLLGIPAGRARVEVVEPDSELFAPREVIDEVVVGLCRLVRLRLRQVDEVGAVGEGVLAGPVAVVLAVAREEIPGLGGEGGAVPFALGFEEEGEGVGADVDGIGDRIVDACN